MRSGEQMATTVVAVTDTRQVLPGDTVHIQGTVLQVVPDVGYLVELFSKTDQYQAWVRPDSVVAVEIPQPPTEPPDGTWLVGSDNNRPNVFLRNDAGAAETRRSLPADLSAATPTLFAALNNVARQMASLSGTLNRPSAEDAPPPGARFVARWYDHAEGEWVTWPVAYARGADPEMRLYPADQPPAT